MKNKLKITIFIIALVLSTSVFAQAKKPSLMIFPATTWMNAKGYFTWVDDQGTKKQSWDYQRAFDTDKELKTVITAIEGLMKSRGFPIDNLGSAMQSNAEQTALNNVDINKTGGVIAESPRDKLLKTAKPDIIIEIDWTVYHEGGKNSINLVLAGKESGTNKTIATAPPGTSQPSFSSDITNLVSEAILDKIDNFNAQLQAHFDDMFANGKEITLNIKVWDNSQKKLNDEINDEGDLLKDDLKKWVAQNTVKGRFTLSQSSPNFMSFTQVRIPLFDADGVAFDADAFATNLRKHIRKTYKIPSESNAIGLGIAEVAIGVTR
jgi:hypothetical protein